VHQERFDTLPMPPTPSLAVTSRWARVAPIIEGFQ
jgi:hypothetical protein